MANIYQRSGADNLSLQELTLYHQIMDYRAESGLPPMKLSKALTTTAARHVIDTRENLLPAGGLPEGQNLHTWSDAPYYTDNSNPEAMWYAPRRLGTGYTDAGYEIAAAGQADVTEALVGWQGSPSHNNVILNRGPWAAVDYNAVGVGVDTRPTADLYRGRVFNVWFGEAPDPTGIPRIVGTGAADRVRGTVFSDDIVGLGGDDRIGGGGGGDMLWGYAGNDTITAGPGHDRLYGGDGDDYLRSGTGSDRLVGGDGADRLIGEGGSDTFFGGRGRDVISGGADSDVFVFRTRPDAGIGQGRDVITDFQQGLDRIDLSVLDGDLTRAGNQGFDFIGGGRFSATAGELNYRSNVLSADVNGDARVDFQIEIENGVALSAADFIL